MRHTVAFQIVLQFTHCDNIEARGLLFYCVKAVLEAQGAPTEEARVSGRGERIRACGLWFRRRRVSHSINCRVRTFRTKSPPVPLAAISSLTLDFTLALSTPPALAAAITAAYASSTSTPVMS